MKSKDSPHTLAVRLVILSNGTVMTDRFLRDLRSGPLADRWADARAARWNSAAYNRKGAIRMRRNVENIDDIPLRQTS